MFFNPSLESFIFAKRGTFSERLLTLILGYTFLSIFIFITELLFISTARVLTPSSDSYSVMKRKAAFCLICGKSKLENWMKFCGITSTRHHHFCSFRPSFMEIQICQRSPRQNDKSAQDKGVFHIFKLCDYLLSLMTRDLTRRTNFRKERNKWLII